MSNAAGSTTDSGSSLPSSSLSPSENRIFKKWRKEFSLLTGYGIDPGDRVFTINRRNCERWKKDLLNYSPSIQFMFKHLQQAGANATPAHFPCMPCDLTHSGGFAPDAGAVVLCQGNFLNKKHMEHTIVHELVHMYDHAVFNVDWNNLRHHACSEIRANSLSGDCSWGREIQRGILSFSKQHQVRANLLPCACQARTTSQTCVRRRAVMSVMANPNCPDKESAERAVNEVWESCFNDTRPFDELHAYTDILKGAMLLPRGGVVRLLD
ncbi:metalloprotease ATP23 [Lactarius hatsudake]|nr:metalloprotease ATP23 [Lactarius hatsudake]